MSYTLSFYYVMYYIVSEICIGGRFLEDCFYCNSQRIIFAVANESLIPYDLIKRAPETQNVTPSQIKEIKNTAQFLEQNILLHTNINNRDMCKIVCKMQYLKDCL